MKMSNNKQSSIEFLIKQKEKWGLLINDDLRIAKAMHKEEITQAWKKGDGQFDKVSDKMSLDYYNETFGGKDENI